MKKTIIIFVVALLVIAGIYYFIRTSSTIVSENNSVPKTQNSTTTDIKTPEETKDKSQTTIGNSSKGIAINAYHFGTGDTEILLVGGVHGGYSWNTSLLAYEIMDYFKTNLEKIPKNIKVTVIPVLNPDGLNLVVGKSTKFTQADVSTSETVLTSGRFNANNVDLNRNFDCNWQAIGTWQSKKVSGGDKVFSEKESLAMKNYIETQKPKAVVSFYSAANGVYSSNCNTEISQETVNLTNTYAKASGYPAYKEFNYYKTTGDMVDWLAKINIPAISVLLSNHTDTEFNKNISGINAIIKSYTK
jgi:murein tripeptide amidase MpaA